MTESEWLVSSDPAAMYEQEEIRASIDLLMKDRADVNKAILAEREACAKLVAELFDEMRLWENVKDGGEALASAIRARAS